MLVVTGFILPGVSQLTPPALKPISLNPDDFWHNLRIIQLEATFHSLDYNDGESCFGEDEYPSHRLSMVYPATTACGKEGMAANDLGDAIPRSRVNPSN